MEKFYRNHTPIKIDGSSINFQAIDWTETNEDLSKDPGEENDFFSPVTETYVIRAFGVTESGQSVCCNIVHFLPFFYVKVPNNWQKTDVSVFLARLIGSQIKSKKGNYWNSLEKYKDCFIKEKCILQKKHEFYGFTGKKEYKFLKLVFNNSFALINTVKVLNQHNDSTSEIKGYSFKFKIYESNLNSLLRFFHKKDIKPCGWMSVDDYIVNNVKVSKCQIEITVNWKSMKPLVNLSNSQLLQATFDIETDSGDGHSFPMAKNVNDYVIQIATTFKKANESSFYLRHLICLKECAPITKEEIDSECEVIVESYNTEVEVILAWTKLIIKMDPDIIYGYNSDSFDFKYIYDRAVSLNCIDEFLKISRIHHIPAEMRSRSFYSTARGYTEFNRLKIHGRVNFDVMIYIQITFKLVKYTLDFVSRHFLGDNKVPLDYKEMFRLFKKGNPDGIKTVGIYCLKDTDLPQKLVDKLLILQTQISMSNITYVPITYLIERGQQIKTFSLMLKTTAKLNYVVPTLFSYNEDDDRKVFKRSVDDDSDSDKEDDEFTGATVLPPKSGAYYIPVVTNDFKSLYPSIMMAHGLCHSTIVLNDKFLGLPGFTYTNHSWEDIKKDGTVVKHSNTYARDNSLKEKEIYGILPKILEGLVNERQFYKDEMKKAKKAGNSFIASVFDANQSAVKLTMNSIYGFLGANMLPCVKIASTVTYLGRKMIEASKNYVEKEFKGSEVIYGDSVTGDTPLLLEKNGKVFIETIQSIFDTTKKVSFPEFKMFDETVRLEKEYSTTDFKIWTPQGYSKIKKVIRHYCNKKIYRVLTHSGFVKVTEDHSLLNENGEIIKPNDCNLETKLLTSYPGTFHMFPCDLTERDAYNYGICFGYNIEGIYDKLINAEINVIESFMEGYNCNKLFRLPLNDLQKAVIYYLNRKRGFYENTNQVTKIEILDQEPCYVYDIETETGVFQAGVGDIIVKNTDSIFITFNTKKQRFYEEECQRVNNQVVITENDNLYLGKLKTEIIKEAMELGDRSAKLCTEVLFKYPIELDYEKTNMPCILFTKKRYIIQKYENDPEIFKVTSKGILLNRRDNFKLSKKIYQKIVDILMSMNNLKDKRINEIYSLINDTIQDIITKKIDISDLIVVKTYNPPKKNHNLAQIVLANKIKERDPGKAPRYGDKISYVLTETDNPKDPQYKKAEDPDYVMENNLPLDLQYYIQYLEKPLCQLLANYIDNPKEIFRTPIKEYKAMKKLQKK